MHYISLSVDDDTVVESLAQNAYFHNKTVILVVMKILKKPGTLFRGTS